MSTTSTPNRKSFAALTPAALVIAGVLAGSLFSESLRPSAALAQEKGDSMTNALEQRKVMIEKLTMMNDRMTKIEAALSSGIKVKVTEMPPVTMKEATK
jgi:hypothetical protein